MEFLKILEVILEGYNDIPLERIKSFKKMTDYNGFNNKKITNDFTYLNFQHNNDYFLWAEIKAFDNKDGTEVGNSSYGKENESDPLKATVDVRPDKRRNGIASTMYKWIEEITNNKLYPDLPHSPSAEKMWGNPKRDFGYDK